MLSLCNDPTYKSKEWAGALPSPSTAHIYMSWYSNKNYLVDKQNFRFLNTLLLLESFPQKILHMQNEKTKEFWQVFAGIVNRQNIKNHFTNTVCRVSELVQKAIFTFCQCNSDLFGENKACASQEGVKGKLKVKG